MNAPANPNSFNFLAHPPPTRSRFQHSEPPPSKATVRTIFRPRSSTKTTISTWVAGILPDSPTPASPPVPSTFSRRSSFLISASASPIPHSKDHTPELRTPTYACTVVPLPIPPYTSAPSQSSFPAERQFDNPPDEMKVSRLLMRQNKASVPLASPPSPTPPKKRGLVRFLRSRPRFRSTPTRHPSPPTPAAHASKFSHPPASSSPTTIAFRIAGQKRALYTQLGLLPLPLDSEVAIMQFLDGGSRADAEARLGTSYKDEAGVVYADEAEAGECLPLLLAIDNGPDDLDTSGGLPNAHSGASGRLASTPAPLSHLSPMSTPPRTALHSPAQVSAVPSRRALFSIPARGGGSSAPRYLHATLPSPPPHFGGLGTKSQFSPPVEVSASRRKQRRRPAPLVLHFPTSAMGFEDSFAPSVVVEAPSPTAQEAGAAPEADIDARNE
ncbi:hypothetical protein BC827DRAFT_1228350 [Russula dissimulans]|nr:hypothetical protein BC827DRAFT_1228350 [Russula dissimulans]